MLKNTSNTYGTVTKIFHWGIGLLIIGLVIAGLIMVEMEKGDLKWQFYGLHKATGVIVFFLALMRLGWRWINPVPKFEPGIPKFVEWAATTNIRFLYGLMILYPLSGFLMSTLGGHPIDIYGLYTIEPLGKNPDVAKNMHFLHVYIFEYALFLSFGVHVIGALYHHFIRRDATLKRII